MLSHTAQYYDSIYLATRDYGAEADKMEERHNVCDALLKRVHARASVGHA